MSGDLCSDVAVCTTLGKTELSGIILAEAVRMSYSLGLHRPKSVLGGDFLQTQMQRRLFWILYQTDKCVFVSRSPGSKRKAHVG